MKAKSITQVLQKFLPYFSSSCENELDEMDCSRTAKYGKKSRSRMLDIFIKAWKIPLIAIF